VKNLVFSISHQQMGKIEQIVLDRDEKEALIFITGIYKKLRDGQIGCDPTGQRIGERLVNAIDKRKVK